MTESSADMAAIVERLERLEKVLVRLCEAVEHRAVATTEPAGVSMGKTTVASPRVVPVTSPVPATAQAPAKQAPKPVPVVAKAAAPKPVVVKTPPKVAQATNSGERPASIDVVLPSVKPKMPTGPPPDVEPLLDEAQAALLASKELDLAPWLPPQEADPQALIECLFRFALQASDIGNPMMLALFHSDVISAPRSPEHLKAFNFPKLRRNIQLYLTDADPASYVLVRSEIDDAQISVKVFLHRLGGMPSPVRLKRDPEENEAWRIVQMSL